MNREQKIAAETGRTFVEQRAGRLQDWRWNRDRTAGTGNCPLSQNGVVHRIAVSSRKTMCFGQPRCPDELLEKFFAEDAPKAEQSIPAPRLDATNGAVVVRPNSLEDWKLKLADIAKRTLNAPTSQDYVKLESRENLHSGLLASFKRWCQTRDCAPPPDLTPVEVDEELDAFARQCLDQYLPADVPAVLDNGRDLPAAKGPWAAASGIDHFLESTESTAGWLIKDIIAREAITVMASPRGLGKTNLGYAWAILLARAGCRVLLIDRDNPKSDIRRRLKAWGGAGLGDKFKIVARDQAPPLTDKAAWAAFPYDEYDFVILDSISAATEGVEEGDGGKAGAGLAPLLDAARKGPAVLLLANTTKDGLKVRGSGTLSDRADLVFEVRDATDLKVEAKHQFWWDGLPDSAEHMWSDRAKRRRRRDSYRLALVTSKFRLGEEPDPSAFEVHHDSDPWSVIDVTAEIEAQLEEAKRLAKDEAQAKIDIAVAALRKALPIAKNPDALDVLLDHGLSRNGARRLLADRINRDWIITGKGSKKSPHIVELAAGMNGSPTPTETTVPDGPIPAALVPVDRQESMFKNDSPPMTLEAPHSCRLNQERGYREQNRRWFRALKTTTKVSNYDGD